MSLFTSLSAQPIDKLAQLLSSQDARISYSFFGTPHVTVITDSDQFLSCPLDELIEKAWKAEHDNTDCTAPEKIIERHHFISKVHSLDDLSEKEVSKAHLITRLFISVRNFFSKLFEKCALFPTVREEINFLRHCYIGIPRSVAEQNDFIKRHPPKRFDSFSGDALYTREQVSEIYKTLPQS